MNLETFQQTVEASTNASKNLNPISDKFEVAENEKGGIAIPAVMYFMGVPFFLVLLLWFFFFRG